MAARISAGIITCNEERTIGPVLRYLSTARSADWEVAEIIVVSAECRDRTDEIVQGEAAQNPRIKLIAEPKRRGKSAAVNTFLEARTSTDLTLLSSGDVLPAENFLEKVVPHFRDPKVGMAGGRPVPVNDPGTLLGSMARLMWDMHHEIALQSPKLGETIMFRSGAVQGVPPESAVDEASIEAAILQQGMKLSYEPEAIVHNRGPNSLREWLSQRRRIAFGHAWLKAHSQHAISTGANSAVAGLLARQIWRNPGQLIPGIFLIGCEALARVQAQRDSKSSKQHQIWELAASTKTGLSK